METFVKQKYLEAHFCFSVSEEEQREPKIGGKPRQRPEKEGSTE